MSLQDSAEFILISDVDGVLTPLFGNTYFEEFRNFALPTLFCCPFHTPRVFTEFTSR